MQGKMRELGLFIQRSEGLVGDLIIVHKYLEGGYEKDRARHLSKVPRDRTKGSGHKLKYRRSPLNIRKHYFTVRVTKQWLRVPSEIVEFLSLDIVKSHLDLATGSGWPCLSGGSWTKWLPEVPSLTFQACSVILWCCIEYNPFIRKRQDWIFFG